MDLYKAAEELKKMRDNAPYGEVSVQAILFGIKHHRDINGARAKDLSMLVGNGSDTCSMELNYGVKLAKYVRLI